MEFHGALTHIQVLSGPPVHGTAPGTEEMGIPSLLMQMTSLGDLGPELPAPQAWMWVKPSLPLLFLPPSLQPQVTTGKPLPPCSPQGLPPPHCSALLGEWEYFPGYRWCCQQTVPQPSASPGTAPAQRAALPSSNHVPPGIAHIPGTIPAGV